MVCVFVSAVTSVRQKHPLSLYMQTSLFWQHGAPQMKPQISCNLELFTQKMDAKFACLPHNEATHTYYVYAENKGLAELFSSLLLTACLATVKSNTGGGAQFAPFAPFIASNTQQITRTHTHTHTHTTLRIQLTRNFLYKGRAQHEIEN